MAAVHGATGWRPLVRLALRTDRVLMPVSIAVLVLLALTSALATPGLYADAAARRAASDAINANPAIVALYGPVLDPGSEGDLAMTKLTVLYAAAVAALFVVLVRRHTRVEEETGRAELLGAAAIGRQAPMVATAALAAGWALVLGVLTAAVDVLGGLDAAGSAAFGAMWAGTALVGAGLAMVTAQLSASARTCGALAAAVLAAWFVVRAVGDTSASAHWLVWLSPLGWNTRVSAFSDPRWWLLAAYPLLAAALGVAGWWLRSRRDLGGGLLAARQGPGRAGAPLGSPLGLVLRLHRVTMLVWAVAALGVGTAFGAIVPTVGDLLDSATAREVIDQLGGQLVAALLSVMAVVLGYFPATVAAHHARDEDDGLAEQVLAAATTRVRWLGACALVALGGASVLMLLTGVGLQLGASAADGPPTGDLVLASAAWVPALWLVAALGLLSVALGRRAAATVWAWPLGFLTLEVVAASLDLPRWLRDLSPYAHVPAIPAAPWSWGSAVGMGAGALAVLAIALLVVRRRDIG